MVAGAWWPKPGGWDLVARSLVVRSLVARSLAARLAAVGCGALVIVG